MEQPEPHAAEGHPTTLAVWDHHSPIVVDTTFTLKAGAKCAAGCRLGGKAIEVRDETGAVRATGVLGDEPWPGTTALYWTTIDAQAPPGAGQVAWTLTFKADGDGPPHEGATASLSFVAIERPEHQVVVTVVDTATQQPLDEVYVCLGVHRGATDASGRATFAVSGGVHCLAVSKTGYDAPETMVAVTRGEELSVEMAAVPEEDPFAFWMR